MYYYIIFFSFYGKEMPLFDPFNALCLEFWMLLIELNRFLFVTIC